jgi:hypothetical protein
MDEIDCWASRMRFPWSDLVELNGTLPRRVLHPSGSLHADVAAVAQRPMEGIVPIETLSGSGPIAATKAAFAAARSETCDAAALRVAGS